MKEILFCIIVTFSIGGFAQSLENPDVFLDKKNRLLEFRDGEFIYYFDKSKLSSFASSDSAINFDFIKSRLSLYNSNGDSLRFEFNSDYKKINDSIVKFPANNYYWDTTKLIWNKYTIKIHLFGSGRKCYYDIRIQWDNRIVYLTTLYKNSKLETIYSLDNENEIGLTIGGSFRTGKYVWKISPFYIEERLDQQTNRIGIYNKLVPYSFYYEFNRLGRFKPSISKGRVNYY